ncbi:MAG: RNase III inhibitor, partial [Bacteroidetes bacterium]|nr:RNase III inhibitor [Bacteroidota bacterium]
STGAFGYPMKEAARVAFQTIRKEAQDSETPGLIRFVMFDDNAYHVHRSVLDTL